MDRAQHGHAESIQRIAVELLVEQLEGMLERELDVLQRDHVSSWKGVRGTTYFAAAIEVCGVLAFTKNPHARHLVGMLTIV